MLKVTVREWDYDGPGAADWIIALCCTAMLAIEIKMLGATAQIQTAQSYYFATPGVVGFHRAAIALDVLILLSIFLWLVSPWKKAAGNLPIVAAGCATSLCWIELVRALEVQRNNPFQLLDLPRSPINNLGLLGAQVFVAYILFRMPLPGIKGFAAVVVRIALAACLWIIQSVVWDVVSGPGTG